MEGKRTVLITGCSSGFGLLAALRFHKEGLRVIATMRDVSHAGPLREAGIEQILPLDVTSDSSVASAMSHVDRLDVLVNNAGYGYFSFQEHADMEEARQLFDTNVLGVLRVTKAALPILRRLGGGRIINLSSIVGKITYPFSGVYAATKHAVEALTESLNYEVGIHGISVCLIEPGYFQTDFQNRSLRMNEESKDPSSPYAPIFEAVKARRATLKDAAGDPALVVEAIVRAATDEPPKLRYRVGSDCEELLAEREKLSDPEWTEYIRSLYPVTGRP
jgi:NAD(P)-dependent dehydrogenase (short-subunit alcohol dehydrogenase family)